MTNKERFEILWTCHHRQIDENRAVHKSLEELRSNALCTKKLVQKVNKAAFLLGLATGGMKSIYWFPGTEDLLVGQTFQRIGTLIEKLDEAIEELFYSDEV